METEVRTTIRDFIAESFMYRRSIKDVGDDDSLVARGIFDSVGVMVLISFLEEKFRLQVADDEVQPENLGSIACTAAFVMRKIESKGV
jgi:acyl carrier protein